MRWRTTDPPIVELTINPRRGVALKSGCVSVYRTSEGVVARKPVFVVRAKSLLDRNRLDAGSTVPLLILKTTLSGNP